eukprot:INCI4096.3.p1 GENE.INCI4096.3~~INCI4096.3.p1  ORF type:complete len:891 (+),score=153.96 INCI4096.3:235-2907(+)
MATQSPIAATHSAPAAGSLFREDADDLNAGSDTLGHDTGVADDLDSGSDGDIIGGDDEDEDEEDGGSVELTANSRSGLDSTGLSPSAAAAAVGAAAAEAAKAVGVSSSKQLQPQQPPLSIREPIDWLVPSRVVVEPAASNRSGKGSRRKNMRGGSSATTPSSPAVYGRNACVFCHYAPGLCEPRNVPPAWVEDEDGEAGNSDPGAYRPAFSILPTSATPLYWCHWERNIIKRAFAAAGIVRTKDRKHMQWSILWSQHDVSDQMYKKLQPWQKVNHFPGTWALGSKDRLALRIEEMRRRFASVFNIAPQSFILPRDEGSLLRAVKARHTRLWIKKPTNSSRGRGIRVVSNDQVRKRLTKFTKKKKNVMIQEYMDKPYLINGFKFDIRMYVLVSSFDPLRVYVFDDGLVRFCTMKYSNKIETLSQPYMHLTNVSLNKDSPDFVNNTDANVTNVGSKWTLKSLFLYLIEHEGIEKTEKLKRDMHEIVCKALIATEMEIVPAIARAMGQRTMCAFEVFGFDLMFDKHLRPSLVEVNISPALGATSELDKVLKCTMLSDVLHLVGVRAPPLPRASNRGSHSARTKPNSRLGAQAMKASSKHLASAATTYVQNISSGKRSIANLHTMKLSEMGDAEWRQIRILNAEYARRGHFIRVYPTLESLQFLKYFENPRYNNYVLAKYLSTMAVDQQRRQKSKISAARRRAAALHLTSGSGSAVLVGSLRPKSSLERKQRRRNKKTDSKGIPNEHGPPNVHSGSDQSDALERVLGANLDREQTRSASVSEHLVETRSPRATGAGQVEDSNESQSTGVTLGTDRSTIHSLHTTACEFSSPRYSRLGEASGSDANSFGDENSTTGKGASAHTATDTSRTARDDPVERLARVIRDGDLPVGRCVQ